MFKNIFKPVDFAKMSKRLKVLAIIAAVIGIAMGIMLIIAPYASTVALIWIIIGFTGLSALGSVFYFIFPGKGKQRNGASLALAILILILVVGLILCAVYAKPIHVKGYETITGFQAMSMQMLVCFSIFFGVFTIVRSIYALCTVGSSEVEHKGLFIAEAIFSLIFGICMTFFPFVLSWVAAIVAGVYVIFASCGIIAIVCKNWKGPKNAEEKVVSNNEKTEEKK